MRGEARGGVFPPSQRFDKAACSRFGVLWMWSICPARRMSRATNVRTKEHAPLKVPERPLRVRRTRGAPAHVPCGRTSARKEHAPLKVPERPLRALEERAALRVEKDLKAEWLPAPSLPHFPSGKCKQGSPHGLVRKVCNFSGPCVSEQMASHHFSDQIMSSRPDMETSMNKTVPELASRSAEARTGES